MNKNNLGKILIPLSLLLVMAICLVLLIYSIAYATPIGAENTKLGGYTGPVNGYAQADNVKSSLDLLHQKMLGVGNGSVWYVDSGVDGTAGDSWSTAVGTVEEAVALASADDTVLIAQGHNEALAAAGWDADKAGMQFIGFGTGSNKPTFDFDTSTATACCSIGAENVTFKNLRFRISANKVSYGIDVEAGGDGAQIIDCDFGFAETAGTDEFSVGINVTSAAHNVRIAGLYMDGGYGDAINGIYVGTVSGFILEDSTISGDFSTACVNNVGASDTIFIRRNTLINGTMGGDGEINSVAAISMADGSGGFINDNRIVSDVATALLMRVADDMIFMNNYVSDTDGDEFSGSRESGPDIVGGGSVSSHVDG